MGLTIKRSKHWPIVRETEFQFANRSYDQTIKIWMSFERENKWSNEKDR